MDRKYKEAAMSGLSCAIVLMVLIRGLDSLSFLGILINIIEILLIIVVAAFTGVLAVYVNRRSLTNITDIATVTAVAGLVGGIVFDIIYLFYIWAFSGIEELGGIGVADIMMVALYCLPAIIVGVIYGVLTVKSSKPSLSNLNVKDFEQ